MTDQLDKATALAEKITKKAEDALSGLDREMVIMKWPHEFREIMWGAVVVMASRLRSESAAAADRDRGASAASDHPWGLGETK